jgi:hypothetical protein
VFNITPVIFVTVFNRRIFYINISIYTVWKKAGGEKKYWLPVREIFGTLSGLTISFVVLIVV